MRLSFEVGQQEKHRVDFTWGKFLGVAKIQVDGLVRSYGPQRLRIYRMSPELGPPELEEISYPDEDRSFEREWANFCKAIDAGDGSLINGGLPAALYAWVQVEAAYSLGPYAEMRQTIGG